jgi:hypothetical protein
MTGLGLNVAAFLNGADGEGGAAVEGGAGAGPVARERICSAATPPPPKAATSANAVNAVVDLVTLHLRILARHLDL